MEGKSMQEVLYKTPGKHTTGTQEDIQHNRTLHYGEKMNLNGQHSEYNNPIWCLGTSFQKVIIKHAHMPFWVN
tara:strand:+ start:578 stop:796 length:219 start_codon:yes stop_codon:yes gene_type:complete